MLHNNRGHSSLIFHSRVLLSTGKFLVLWEPVSAGSVHRYLWHLHLQSTVTQGSQFRVKTHKSPGQLHILKAFSRSSEWDNASPRPDPLKWSPTACFAERSLQVLISATAGTSQADSGGKSPRGFGTLHDKVTTISPGLPVHYFPSPLLDISLWGLARAWLVIWISFPMFRKLLPEAGESSQTPQPVEPWTGQNNQYSLDCRKSQKGHLPITLH